jgi:hypothetical protein
MSNPMDTIKRPRGRPPKNKPPMSPHVARGRGRPPRSQAPMPATSRPVVQTTMPAAMPRPVVPAQPVRPTPAPAPVAAPAATKSSAPVARRGRKAKAPVVKPPKAPKAPKEPTSSSTPQEVYAEKLAKVTAELKEDAMLAAALYIKNAPRIMADKMEPLSAKAKAYDQCRDFVAHGFDKAQDDKNEPIIINISVGGEPIKIISERPRAIEDGSSD